MLADITEEKDRSKNFNRMSISANLGFILGPALAGSLILAVSFFLLMSSSTPLTFLAALFFAAGNRLND